MFCIIIEGTLLSDCPTIIDAKFDPQLWWYYKTTPFFSALVLKFYISLTINVFIRTFDTLLDSLDVHAPYP